MLTLLLYVVPTSLMMMCVCKSKPKKIGEIYCLCVSLFLLIFYIVTCIKSVNNKWKNSG